MVVETGDVVVVLRSGVMVLIEVDAGACDERGGEMVVRRVGVVVEVDVWCCNGCGGLGRGGRCRSNAALWW